MQPFSGKNFLASPQALLSSEQAMLLLTTFLILLGILLLGPLAAAVIKYVNDN